MNATRTAAEVTAEIARLQRVMSDWNIEGRLDADTEADMQAEITELQGELYLIEDVEPAGAGAFNIPLFVAAFGRTPEEEFAS